MHDNVRRLRRPAATFASAAGRQSVSWNGILTTGQTKIRCDILDISPHGAKFRLHGELPIGTSKFWLIMDFLGPLPAKLTWQANQFLGCSFLTEAPILRRLERLLTEHRRTSAASTGLSVRSRS